MNGTTTGTSAMSKNFPSVNIQEATLEEARESLREAVQLIIESNNAPKKNTATP
jgi:predicted RNase H-like HicB family nuclease